MNIVIADDKYLVRSSLRSMLAELGLPVRIAGEARNGLELLELLESEPPDLVFVDTRMPKMNGLEAIRRGKEISPSTDWIILTGFTEFEYAQEAIRLGAGNYLLKPADPAELNKCVRMAMEQKDRKTYSLNCEFEHWMSARIRGQNGGTNTGMDSAYAGYAFAALELFTDSRRPDDETRLRLQQAAGEWLARTVPPEARHKVRQCAVVSDPMRMTCVWAWPVRDEDRNPAKRFPWPDRAESALRSADNIEWSLRALATDTESDVPSLLKKLEELRRLSPLRVFIPPSALLTAQALRAEAAAPGKAERAESWISLSEAVKRRDYVGYSKLLAEIRKRESPSWSPDSPAVRALSAFLRASAGASVEAGMNEAAWFGALQDLGERMLSAGQGTEQASQTDLLRRVIQYVEKRYMDDIGIGTLAEEFGLTPNYLSALFHKKQGVTFVKYLTRTRMLKAKELLLTQPGMKVNQVAEAVGYFSTRHFTKLFVEHFGAYPSEIREKSLS